MLTLWSYWEGELSPFMRLCIESLERHNPTFSLMTPERLREMEGGEEVLDFTKGVPIPYRSDYIRLWLLERFGGVWTDSDCIGIAPLELLAPSADYDLTAVLTPGSKKRILATPFGGRPGSPAFGIMRDHVGNSIRKVQEGKKINYGATSTGVLSGLYRTRKQELKIDVREHWKFNRVHWSEARRVFLRRAGAWQHENNPAWSPATQIYHLTHTVPAKAKELTRERILRDNTFASFLFQKSFGLPPAVPGRTKSLLDNLPPGPLHGVEIGSFRGQNARSLLQQRDNLSLTMVDPWGNVQDTYKRTRDPLASLPQRKWEGLYAHCQKLMEFAGDRVTLLREFSQDAVHEYGEQSLDFVFIDAEHSEAAVYQDIISWVPKIKPGGLLCGHDYGQRSFPGVKKAVDRYASETGQEVTTGLDTTWFIRLGTT